MMDIYTALTNKNYRIATLQNETIGELARRMLDDCLLFCVEI